MDENKIDVHLVIAARVAAGREALRLLGMSSIHASDQLIQQRVFGEAVEVAVPFAVHCRRLIELIRYRKKSFKIPLQSSREFEPYNPKPRDFFVALNAIIHSRTIHGRFVSMREKEATPVDPQASRYVVQWAEDARKARDAEVGVGMLGSSGNNPWRLTPILIVETDRALETDKWKNASNKDGQKAEYEKAKQIEFPAIALAETYFDIIEPEVEKAFGADIDKWAIWDVL